MSFWRSLVGLSFQRASWEEAVFRPTERWFSRGSANGLSFLTAGVGSAGRPARRRGAAASEPVAPSVGVCPAGQDASVPVAEAAAGHPLRS